MDKWHRVCLFGGHKAFRVQSAHTMGKAKQYSMSEYSPAWASTNEVSYYILMSVLLFVLDIVATLCYYCIVAGNGVVTPA
ncbi:hypothetical protein LCGC14_2721300, partial [marine sediment metagenome]